MKKQVDILDATPHKRFILSIVPDYDLTKSICELIDNSLDIWIKNAKKNKLSVEIEFDSQQKTITYRDNAGGIPKKHMEYLISPGATTNATEDFTIGVFGVGVKRAVIALSEDVKILSRFGKNKTFGIEFDKTWLKDEDWHIPCYEFDQIGENTTVIELQKLLISITEIDIKILIENVSAIYARFLSNGKLKICINSRQIDQNNFTNWAYPPNYQPRRYHGTIKTKEGRDVSVEVIAGLTTESSPTAGEYGIYVYCNDRLIVGALKSPEVGFIKGIAGFPHPSLSILRIMISFKGAAIDMPWNSSKSNINTNHYIFTAFRNWLFEVVKNYCSLSRRLEGNWSQDVFKYAEGEFIDVPISDFSIASKSYLIELPSVNIRYADAVKQKNSAIEKTKIWTRGLSESIVAVEYVLKQKLVTKNRISLILLDSTLEIAFKEYLVHDSGKHYTDSELLNLFKARHLVETEIKKYIPLSKINASDWKQLKYFYDLRCKLVHERATVNIADPELRDFLKLTQKILKTLFNLRF